VDTCSPLGVFSRLSVILPSIPSAPTGVLVPTRQTFLDHPATANVKFITTLSLVKHLMETTISCSGRRIIRITHCYTPNYCHRHHLVNFTRQSRNKASMHQHTVSLSRHVPCFALGVADREERAYRRGINKVALPEYTWIMASSLTTANSYLECSSQPLTHNKITASHSPPRAVD